MNGTIVKIPGGKEFCLRKGESAQIPNGTALLLPMVVKNPAQDSMSEPRIILTLSLVKKPVRQEDNVLDQRKRVALASTTPRVMAANAQLACAKQTKPSQEAHVVAFSAVSQVTTDLPLACKRRRSASPSSSSSSSSSSGTTSTSITTNPTCPSKASRRALPWHQTATRKEGSLPGISGASLNGQEPQSAVVAASTTMQAMYSLDARERGSLSELHARKFQPQFSTPPLPPTVEVPETQAKITPRLAGSEAWAEKRPPQPLAERYVAVKKSDVGVIAAPKPKPIQPPVEAPKAMGHFDQFLLENEKTPRSGILAVGPEHTRHDPAAVPDSAGSDGLGFLRELIRGVYVRQNPSKLGDLDKLFQKYAGGERELYLSVCRKYGEEPVLEYAATPGSNAIEHAPQTSRLSTARAILAQAAASMAALPQHPFQAAVESGQIMPPRAKSFPGATRKASPGMPQHLGVQKVVASTGRGGSASGETSASPRRRSRSPRRLLVPQRSRAGPPSVSGRSRSRSRGRPFVAVKSGHMARGPQHSVAAVQLVPAAKSRPLAGGIILKEALAGRTPPPPPPPPPRDGGVRLATRAT